MSSSRAPIAAALAGTDLPPLIASRGARLGTAVLFALCFALTAVDPEPADGVASLFALPVALAAVCFGLRGGLAGAVFACALAGGAELLGPGAAYSAAGHVSLGLALSVLGATTGLVVDDARVRAELLGTILRVQDGLGEGVMISEPGTGRFVHGSPAVARLLGRELADELEGVPVTAFVHPADRPKVAERIRLRLAGHPVPPRVDMLLVAADGASVDVDTATGPLRVAGRDYLLTLARDVTEERSAERTLRAEHELSAAVLATADCPVIVLDRESRIVRANPATARLVGRTEGELMGHTPWTLGLVAEEHRATVAATFDALLAGHHQAERISDWIRPDGTRRMVSWAVTAIRDEDGSPLYGVGVGADLTEQRSAERSERRVRAALELRSVELERSNADLSHFASIASHDLREPLRAVAGFSELLHERAWVALDERARTHLDAIRVAARRMEALLDGLRTYGAVGREPAAATGVDLDLALERVLTGVSEELVERDGEIRRAPLPTVVGHPGQLEQVLQNLVSNALKYANGSPPRLDVGARRRGSAWQVTVADNGIGVPERHRTRIFEMFHRLHADDAIPGTGVGLAVCQRIVRRHGGDIWVEDAPGGGSAFSFTVPDPEVRP